MQAKIKRKTMDCILYSIVLHTANSLTMVSFVWSIRNCIPLFEEELWKTFKFWWDRFANFCRGEFNVDTPLLVRTAWLEEILICSIPGIIWVNL